MHNFTGCCLATLRNLNAAITLEKATVGTTGSNASGDETAVSSRKEEATRFIGW